MRVEILTIFPGFFTGPLDETILKRAVEKGRLAVTLRDLRDFATDKHAKTDDVPFGGGPGMVMKPEPVVAAIEAARAAGAGRVLLLDPAGDRFDQRAAERLAREPSLALVCGRYEGFDERIRAFADEELSVGDFVLSGGEPAALVVLDAVARLLEGVLGNEESARTESHGAEGLLEAPSFTRPREFRGVPVPDVLTSGDHEAIRRWRRRESLARTLRRRPDLLESARRDGRLTEEDRKLLDEIAETK